MKIITKIIIAQLVFLMAGCQEYLDITPDGRISLEDVWKDPKMVEAYLNGAYSEMNVNQGGLNYFSGAFLGGITDLFHDSDDFEPDPLIAPMWYQGSLSPTYDPTQTGNNGNIFRVYWSGIRKCNVFLENIDHAQVINEGSRARMKAEARVLRAWYYVQLCKKYGPMPIVETPLSLQTDFLTVKRPGSFQEVADFIDRDWQAVKDVTDFPWRITNGLDKGRMTKAIMLLLRSQAQLFAASPLYNPENDLTKWEKARDYAKEGISLLTANGGYQVYYDPNLGEASFENYFLNSRDFSASPRDKETILESVSPYPMVWPHHSNGFPQRDMEKAGSCPTQELVDMFDMRTTGLPVVDPASPYLDDDHLQPNYFSGSGYDPANPYENRDPRFYATVIYNGAYIPGIDALAETFVGGAAEIRPNGGRRNTRTGYYLRKFLDQAVPAPILLGAYWKRMRFGEFYLNLAEAENELNGPGPDVTAAMKPLRDRVHMPAIPQTITSKEEMRAYIQKERAVELALEEQRVWDVRRWKILDKTDKLVTGMLIEKEGDSFTYERFVVGRRNSWADKYLLFPIPLTEISVLGDEWQNPGW
ncbi:MAG TPA: RagB/SusD family nutrient uptake outer membrane protein [Parapedobacter sp.]|uniref:RagB/SusD family nutrient uptake outer membrane protein n=1 Tax=Parapedobacter sp. TaxID=1958893 RepID=UPI002BCDC627|nr:RagB/SusD family nutrient uptake outer membrane protein [Parapedobacter sp.]HWK57793.1 RagB/SusD family nutrient uptake outer membrane protein [Parapedobacter sp.]